MIDVTVPLLASIAIGENRHVGASACRRRYDTPIQPREAHSLTRGFFLRAGRTAQKMPRTRPRTAIRCPTAYCPEFGGLLAAGEVERGQGRETGPGGKRLGRHGGLKGRSRSRIPLFLRALSAAGYVTCCCGWKAKSASECFADAKSFILPPKRPSELWPTKSPT